MTLEQVEGVVQAVVVHNGRVLLVERAGGWELPSGTPEPAETATATAARVVYELTGYLVDGSTTLEPAGPVPPDGTTPVVCQLLSGSPSDGARLPAERLRWVATEAAARSALPPAVRDYLRGHSAT
ncbi:NUDIX domain-containing protein [Streptomyces sp. NPDC127190]|uniref:NUDIX domain-containing protein n=1 Tax=unclassified Streptomyces TaxID=2593676 RepID=UPI0036283065